MAHIHIYIELNNPQASIAFEAQIGNVFHQRNHGLKAAKTESWG